MKSTTHSCTLMEKFRSIHYIVEASFLFLCIANARTVYNKHLATIRTEQATFSKNKKKINDTVELGGFCDIARSGNSCFSYPKHLYWANLLVEYYAVATVWLIHFHKYFDLGYLKTNVDVYYAARALRHDENDGSSRFPLRKGISLMLSKFICESANYFMQIHKWRQLIPKRNDLFRHFRQALPINGSLQRCQ